MKKDFKMRTGLIVGEDGLDKLKNANVIVFGVGGVGSFACEAIVRAGVGNITIVDFDDVDITNINRQIPALHSTVGRYKVEVMKERILSINPHCHVLTYDDFFLPETVDHFPFDEFDYIVDAVDTVTAKTKLVEIAQEKKIKIISSMGTGNKLDPTKLEVTDIYKTSICPLARVMRRELKKRGVKDLKVVYSTEKACAPDNSDNGKKAVPGSMSYVPPAAGLILAGEVIKDIAGLGDCTYE